MDLIGTLREFVDSPALFVPLIIAVYIAVFGSMLRTKAGQRVLQAVRAVFFYSEPSYDRIESIRRRLKKIEGRVSELSGLAAASAVSSQDQLAEQQIDYYLREKFPALVEQRLAELRHVDASVDEMIADVVKKEVIEFLRSNPITDIEREAVRIQYEEARQERARILETTIEEQMRSAARLKMVMINLFVMFNVGVLLIYLFAGSSLSDRAVYGIIGLYVSLAAFIVYIYRTSNFRTSVLLALREDGKKVFDALDYLDRRGNEHALSENDVEVLRLLLINRAEREKASEHPYELILRGITNSNIQFKGGRIALGKGVSEK